MMSRDHPVKPNDPADYHRHRIAPSELSAQERQDAEELARWIDDRNKPGAVKLILEQQPKLLAAQVGSYNESLFGRVCLRKGEDMIDTCLRLGGPALKPNIQGTMPFDVLVNNNRPQKDMMEEFARLVLLPALQLEVAAMPESIRPHCEESGSLDNYQYLHSYSLSSMKNSLAHYCDLIFFPRPTAKPTDYRDKSAEEIRDDAFVRQFMRPFRLTRTWDSHLITMPQELLPYRSVRHWEPLLQKDFVTSRGYHITCLTDSRQLREEGHALDHCVGKSTYDISCCKEDATRSHVLSVRDAHGNPLSTMQVMYYPEATQHEYDMPVAGTGYRMLVRQHHGQYNGTPPREATQAVEEFFAMLQDETRTPGYLTTSPAGLGEQVAKREDNAPDPVSRHIGFTPSWEHIEKVFNEYRRPIRRASTSHQNHRLVYDDAISPDDPQGFTRPQHFIDGFVLVDREGNGSGDVHMDRADLHPREGEHIVALRELGLKDWLKATGMMRTIHHLIAEKVTLHKGWAEQYVDTGRKADEARWFGKLRQPTEATVRATEEAVAKNPLREQFLNDVPDRKISGERVATPQPALRRRDRQATYQSQSDTKKSPYFDR